MNDEQFFWDLKRSKEDNYVAITKNFCHYKTYGKSDVAFMYRVRVSSGNMYIMWGDVESFMILGKVGRLYFTLGQYLSFLFYFCFYF